MTLGPATQIPALGLFHHLGEVSLHPLQEMEINSRSMLVNIWSTCGDAAIQLFGGAFVRWYASLVVKSTDALSQSQEFRAATLHPLCFFIRFRQKRGFIFWVIKHGSAAGGAGNVDDRPRYERGVDMSQIEPGLHVVPA